MNSRSIVGVLLIVLGVIALTYHGITYTSHDKVIDLGPIQASADREHTLPVPPIVGGIALAGGIILLFSARFGKRTGERRWN